MSKIHSIYNRKLPQPLYDTSREIIHIILNMSSLLLSVQYTCVDVIIYRLHPFVGPFLCRYFNSQMGELVYCLALPRASVLRLPEYSLHRREVAPAPFSPTPDASLGCHMGNSMEAACADLASNSQSSSVQISFAIQNAAHAFGQPA